MAAESSYVDTSAVQEIHDVLELLGTGINCNTFSDRGRRQNVEVQRFKEAVSAQKHTEQFHRFCKDLLRHISSCIVASGKSMDAIREKSYRRFHQKRISELPELWDDFHATLHLPRPDPLWTQSANRLLSGSRCQSRPFPLSMMEEEVIGAGTARLMTYVTVMSQGKHPHFKGCHGRRGEESLSPSEEDCA